MKIILLSLLLLVSTSSFASRCFLEFKKISVEYGCIEKTSARTLVKELNTVEECYNEAIRMSKVQPIAQKSRIAQMDTCGPDGIFTVIEYFFVAWQYGSFYDFEWPISGKVNLLTNKNIDGFQDGNQVYDKNGFILH